MHSDFELHPQLAADTVALGDWPLCRLLLMNDAQYPWVILVPRRDGIREVYELEPQDQQTLLQESVSLGQTLMRTFAGHKLNVAALGNAVPQLHVHHIVRQTDDPAWPAPVWGRVPPKAYDADALAARMTLLRERLSLR
jgi:diadenosine tetraphosphate (Ap4A) HIT family hydrolase